MTLTKRNPDEFEWPTWFGRRLAEFPESFRDLMEDTGLKVEEFEEDGQLVVRAELPGIDPDEDVEITMSDHMLRLHAHRRTEERTEDKKGYRSEFRYGSFSRTLRLPPEASESDVTATYTDGILEVRIPVDEEQAEARRIPISRT